MQTNRILALVIVGTMACLAVAQDQLRRDPEAEKLVENSYILKEAKVAIKLEELLKNVPQIKKIVRRREDGKTKLTIVAFRDAHAAMWGFIRLLNGEETRIKGEFHPLEVDSEPELGRTL